MKFYIGTRKGLFTYEKQASRWDITHVDFLGDNVSMILFDRRDNTLYAGLNLGHFGAKLRRSTDSGENWDELTPPTFPAGEFVTIPQFDGSEAKQKPASLSEIWEMTAGGDDQPGLLWAGTIPAALFVSRDRGDTWELNDAFWNLPQRHVWFGGGKDDAGLHSISVDPRNSNHVTVAVSCGGTWQTTDGGVTWACRSDGMRAEYMPPDRQFDPEIQDPHRLVQCPGSPDHFWVQHHNGIFKSTNNCESWEEINAEPSSFGLGVAVHPHDPNTAWFVPGIKDEARVPVDGKLVVTRTRDGGETFESLSDGLPQEHAYDIAYRHTLSVDDSGDVLIFGTTTGNLFVSENGGDSWDCLSTTLPPIYVARFG
ncbi:MAG: exo-alpha-sialidase [Planctomycetaceae bacterium]|nr:exo-alpha-sialidase [Planctomycetaceae bacterium]